MEQTSPQRLPAQKGQNAAYNSFTHIIDKGIYNFLIGLAVTIAIILSIGLSLLGQNPHSCIPLLFFLVIAVGFAYAFGGIGISAASTKEEGFKVKLVPAIGATIVGSFCYISSLLFLQIILKFLVFFIPKYHLYIQMYSPRLELSSVYLSRTFCEPGVDFCFFYTQFGRVFSNMVDSVILCIGLVVVFSIINSVVAMIKVMSTK